MALLPCALRQLLSDWGGKCGSSGMLSTVSPTLKIHEIVGPSGDREQLCLAAICSRCSRPCVARELGETCGWPCVCATLVCTPVAASQGRSRDTSLGLHPTSGCAARGRGSRQS
jgi:hypothetical protein